MARFKRSARLESRDARRGLKKSNEPYWVTIDRAVALGYRRGEKAGTWHLRLRHNGVYRREGLGIADDFRDADGRQVLDYWQAQVAARTAAARIVRESDPVWQEKQRAAQEAKKAEQFTVRQAASHYLEWYRAHRKAYSGTKAAVDAHIIPKFGDTPVAELTAPKLRDWHRSLAAKAPRHRTAIGKTQAYGEKPVTDEAKRARRATANRILTILKAILNKAFEDELVNSDSAWRRVKPFKGADEPVIRFLTPAEATRLVNACPLQFRNLVAAALHTGARYSELTTLTVADFNPRTATVYFRPGKGRARHVPLTTEGLQLFTGWAAGKMGTALMFTRNDGIAWSKNHQVRPLTDACMRAKINPTVTFHELRHTYASTLAQRGVDLLTLSKLLGHADTRVTSRHYAHLCDESLKAAVAKLPELGITSNTTIATIR